MIIIIKIGSCICTHRHAHVDNNWGQINVEKKTHKIDKPKRQFEEEKRKEVCMARASRLNMRFKHTTDWIPCHIIIFRKKKTK